MHWETIRMNDPVPENPTAFDLKRLAEALIENQSTMTLATSRSNKPWAAPIYFVCRAGCFYFFSDPASRHIEEARESEHAAAAIHAEAFSWQESEGSRCQG